MERTRYYLACSVDNIVSDAGGHRFRHGQGVAGFRDLLAGEASVPPALRTQMCLLSGSHARLSKRSMGKTLCKFV